METDCSIYHKLVTGKCLKPVFILLADRRSSSLWRSKFCNCISTPHIYLLSVSHTQTHSDVFTRYVLSSVLHRGMVSEKPVTFVCRVNKLFIKHGLLEFSVLFLRRSRFQWPRGLQASVCVRSLAGIVGSNPAGGMNVCLFTVLCIVR